MFQSSPARGGGCNELTPDGDQRVRSVSILTRPWGRVQHIKAFSRAVGLPPDRFNPHPPVGAGATSALVTDEPSSQYVSILTRPWGRVQSWVGCRSRWGCRGFNPHPPVGAGATHFTGLWGRRQLGVSILTRPWGRVQREPSLFRDSGLRVSILTRPWGRVQRAGAPHYGLMGGCFNPHPPVRAGATPATMYPLAPVCCFNPHPPVGAGAT